MNKLLSPKVAGKMWGNMKTVMKGALQSINGEKKKL